MSALTEFKISVFFLVTLIGMYALDASQLHKKHDSQDSIDAEFENIYRESFAVVASSRAPYANDRVRVGTFWINTGSTTLYARFPDPTGWRKVETSVP